VIRYKLPRDRFGPDGSLLLKAAHSKEGRRAGSPSGDNIHPFQTTWGKQVKKMLYGAK